MSKADQEAVIWPWMERCSRTCMDATGLGIGWADDAQRKFGQSAVEAVPFTPRVKEALAYPVRATMEDRRLRLTYNKQVRADLRSVTKQITADGNTSFPPHRTPA